MAKVDIHNTLASDRAGNFTVPDTPVSMQVNYANSVDRALGIYPSSVEVAPKLVNELADAVLSVGAPKSNNSGKTLQESSQSVSGTSAPVASQVSAGTQVQDLDYLNRLIEISQANTAKEQEFAREQMAWQEAQNAKAMDFNAEQAQINRDWQEMMSNTAHQREVADMLKAGINPVLSVSGGNGATVTSGATASGVTSAGSKGSVDTGVTNALASMFGALINAQTMENVARISANSATAVAGINAGSAMAVQNARAEQERFIYQNYPQNVYSLASSLLNPDNSNSTISRLLNDPGEISSKSSGRSFTGNMKKN